MFRFPFERTSGHSIRYTRGAVEFSRIKRLLILQDLIPGDGIAKHRSEDDIGGEVGAQGDARKADGARKTVGSPGNPAMSAITARNDGGDGNGYDRMSRREAAADVGDAVEESV